MQFQKTMITWLDELVFRPMVAIINWQPKRRHCACCHKDTDCLVYFDHLPVSKAEMHQPSGYDWPTIDRMKRSEWRGKNYGM